MTGEPGIANPGASRGACSRQWRAAAWVGVGALLTSGMCEFSWNNRSSINFLGFMLSYDYYALPLLFALLLTLCEESSRRLALAVGLAFSFACVVAVYLDWPWGDAVLLRLGKRDTFVLSYLSEALFAFGAVALFAASVALIRAEWKRREAE